MQHGGIALGLREQGERDEGVGGEEVEGRAAVTLVARGLVQRPQTRGGEHRGNVTGWRVRRDVPVDPLAKPGRRGRRVPGDPVPGDAQRASSQSATTSGVAVRAAASREASPAPADAKWGRPPPLPPLSAASRLTRSPAFRPAFTRSSVTAT